MTDQCVHCTCRGNIEVCQSTECGIHESWYAQTLRSRLESCLVLEKHGPDELPEKPCYLIIQPRIGNIFTARWNPENPNKVWTPFGAVRFAVMDCWYGPLPEVKA